MNTQNSDPNEDDWPDEKTICVTLVQNELCLSMTPIHWKQYVEKLYLIYQSLCVSTIEVNLHHNQYIHGSTYQILGYYNTPGGSEITLWRCHSS